LRIKERIVDAKFKDPRREGKGVQHHTIRSDSLTRKKLVRERGLPVRRGRLSKNAEGERSGKEEYSTFSLLTAGD